MLSQNLNESSVKTPDVASTSYPIGQDLWCSQHLSDVSSLINGPITSDLAANKSWQFSTNRNPSLPAVLALVYYVCIRLFFNGFCQICWEHTTTHYKWQRLHTFHFHAPRVSPRVRERVWLSVRLSMDTFSSNLRWTYYKSHQVAWATYVLC
jgi:hypothetical protein